MLKILVVDDEEIIRNILLDMLSQDGHSVQTAVDGDTSSGKRLLGPADHAAPDAAALKIIRERWRRPLIIITPTENSAVSAMREGAYDHITKPFLIEEIRLRTNILAMRRSPGKHGPAPAQEKYDFSAIIGKQRVLGPEMIRDSIARSNVLIRGAVGKELVARAIMPTVLAKAPVFGDQLRCDSRKPPKANSQKRLFGAYKDKTGLFASADEGSLFLDEIGEMPPGLQTKLLRALEERVIQPIGSTETLPFTARIIAATNKDLAREIGTGSFREDLYYRLNVVEIHVPPLRERQDDIPLLARHFVRKKAGEISIPEPEIDPAAMQALEEYSWKGNIRELENVIERAVIS